MPINTIPLKIILAFLLFICLLEMSYDYYQLVRFAAMLAFAYFAYFANQKKKINEVFIYSGLAILFQPIVKIALSKTVWESIDVLVGLGLLFSLLPSKSTNQNIDNQKSDKKNNINQNQAPKEIRDIDDFVLRIEDVTLKEEIQAKKEVVLEDHLTLKKSDQSPKIKPEINLKNKWLHTSDNLGKLQRGVEYESKIYVRENLDKDTDDFTII